MSSEATLLWGAVFGAVGLAYFVYGKKRRMFVPLFCGIGLMVFPYFVPSTILVVIIGSVLSAIPYLFRF